MKTLDMKLPHVALFAITRIALGAGAGLLLAGRLSQAQRQAIGVTLVAVGLITTVPFAVQIFGED
jgi:enoyl-CoA hydratase/carnithine racemase